jgi:hypothetical protein
MASEQQEDTIYPPLPDSEKNSTLENDSWASSGVKKASRDFDYLEWSTPLTEIWSEPEQLPSSVTRYTDPFTWSATQKSMITALACVSTGMAAYSAGAYTSGISQMERDLGVGRIALLVGITTFTTGFAFAPLVLAPLSEVG